MRRPFPDGNSAVARPDRDFRGFAGLGYASDAAIRFASLTLRNSHGRRRIAQPTESLQKIPEPVEIWFRVTAGLRSRAHAPPRRRRTTGDLDPSAKPIQTNPRFTAEFITFLCSSSMRFLHHREPLARASVRLGQGRRFHGLNDRDDRSWNDNSDRGSAIAMDLGVAAGQEANRPSDFQRAAAVKERRL